MSYGGDVFSYKDPDLDDKLDNDDDKEQEVERAWPFQPGAASTPYRGGEQYEINANYAARGERAARYLV